jgi:hypothetical protein
MNSKSWNRVSTFLALAFIPLWICKNLEPKEPEYLFNGIRIPKKPCISVMNEMYGKGIDSLKICDCLVPAFYEFIKNDSTHLQKFKDVGMHLLEGTLVGKFQLIYNNCVLENIIDTTYRLRFTGVNKDKYLKLFRDSLMMKRVQLPRSLDSLSICIIEKLDSSLTIKETIVIDSIVEHKIMKLAKSCLLD